MTEEQIEAITARSEADYELLKDTVHNQYDMIQDLKDINELHQKLNGELREQIKLTEELAMIYQTKIVEKNDIINKAIEYIEEKYKEDNYNVGNIYRSVYKELYNILKGLNE